MQGFPPYGFLQAGGDKAGNLLLEYERRFAGDLIKIEEPLNGRRICIGATDNLDEGDRKNGLAGMPRPDS